MKYLILIITILFGINCSAEIIGKAKITDGDTIVIEGNKIRFTGSDAPESYFFGKTMDTAEHILSDNIYIASYFLSLL